MELNIVSPHEYRQLKVAWFEIDTPVGNFVIHAGHVPTILTLQKGHSIVVRLKNGKQECIPARHGIVHITRHTSTIILSD